MHAPFDVFLFPSAMSMVKPNQLQTLGNILKELQGNINVPRFTYDKSYRRDVIMNLSEQESCDLAISLATKYNMDLWEVYFKHYNYLLLNELQVPTKYNSCDCEY